LHLCLGPIVENVWSIRHSLVYTFYPPEITCEPETWNTYFPDHKTHREFFLTNFRKIKNSECVFSNLLEENRIVT
jgi:hypothetical protein